MFQYVLLDSCLRVILNVSTISLSTDSRWGKRVLERRQHLGKCSVERLRARWSDDLRKTDDRSLVREAKDRTQ